MEHLISLVLSPFSAENVELIYKPLTLSTRDCTLNAFYNIL